MPQDDHLKSRYCHDPASLLDTNLFDSVSCTTFPSLYPAIGWHHRPPCIFMLWIDVKVAMAWPGLSLLPSRAVEPHRRIRLEIVI